MTAVVTPSADERYSPQSETRRPRIPLVRRAPIGSVRARFVAACTAGGICATAVFTWVTFVGRADPLAPAALGSVYDAQARSLLHGHWDVPASALLFERFKVGGKFYAYFGPWPAVLRMPVVAFTDAFDGRLSRVSMLLAFAVLLGFRGRIDWQARKYVRGHGHIWSR